MPWQSFGGGHARLCQAAWLGAGTGAEECIGGFGVFFKMGQLVVVQFFSSATSRPDGSRLVSVRKVSRMID